MKHPIFVTSSFLSKFQKHKLKPIIANVSAFMYKYRLGFILIHLLLLIFSEFYLYIAKTFHFE